VKNLLKFSALAAILGLLAFGCSQNDLQPTGPASGIQAAALDGSETLGDPVGLTLATGSGIVSAGVGLFPNLSGAINVTVPMGATVKQVILYWEGQHSTPAGDNAIMVNGNAVTGAFIGGGTAAGLFYFPYYSSTYRADITGLGLVTGGASVLNITGMAFVDKNSGAGVVVIYQEPGMPEATILLKDGNDQAWIGFAEPKKSCVPQEFTFSAAMVNRQANVIFHLGSIESARPGILRWWLDGVEQTPVCDPFSYPNDGDEWAEVVIPLTIPAGATSLKFEPVSGTCPTSPLLGGNPQSFVWVAAAVALEGIPMGEGCTPGYWKNLRMHGCNWPAPYTPSTDFDTVFGVNIFSPNRTLFEALSAGGGGWDAFGRHAAAALLNAASGNVNFPYTVAEVIALVQAAYAAGEPEMYKDQLEMANELGCPLGNCR
jgi:hypothetical protein